jgi:hypothetical protein
MIKNINDVSEHGNIGLFSMHHMIHNLHWNIIITYHYYLLIYFRWTWKMVSQKWEEFCELNKIKLIKNNQMDYVYFCQKATVFQRSCELKFFCIG